MNLTKITSRYRGELIITTYTPWLKQNMRVLDVGCGTGVVSNQIKNHFRTKLRGCDIENYLVAKIPFSKMDYIDKLPFANKRFDIALFNDVLHHTPKNNQKKLLREALRVAQAVLVFEVKPTLLGMLSDFIINKIHYWTLDIPFTFRTISGWKNVFDDLQVNVEVVEVHRPFFYPFSHVAFRLQRKKQE